MTDLLDPWKALIAAAGSGREEEEAAINRYCSLVAPDIQWVTKQLTDSRREVRMIAARTLLALDRTTTAEESHPITQAAAAIRFNGHHSGASIACIFVVSVISANFLWSIGLPPEWAVFLVACPALFAWRRVVNR